MKNLYRFLPAGLVNYLKNCPFKNDITEIRLRTGNIVQLTVKGKIKNVENIKLSNREVEDILYAMCENSINAYEDEISNGFITLHGGHRVGIGGEFYCNRAENKNLIKKLYSLNIRVAKSAVFFENQQLVFDENPVSTLIIGPPHSGKTSFIKAYAEILSKNFRVCLCDERREIYSDGINCDVIQGIDKPTAISMATRTLNPQFIVCDEIGSKREAEEILSAINTGVDFICTAHGISKKDIERRPNIKILLDSGVFRKMVVLCGNSFGIKELINV